MEVSNKRLLVFALLIVAISFFYYNNGNISGKYIGSGSFTCTIGETRETPNGCGMTKQLCVPVLEGEGTTWTTMEACVNSDDSKCAEGQTCNGCQCVDSLQSLINRLTQDTCTGKINGVPVACKENACPVGSQCYTKSDKSCACNIISGGNYDLGKDVLHKLALSEGSKNYICRQVTATSEREENWAEKQDFLVSSAFDEIRLTNPEINTDDLIKLKTMEGNSGQLAICKEVGTEQPLEIFGINEF